ncbi:BREX-1 system adenine-specific DNA-methyltransferase PglX [Bifidobacterium cuniculi]|uniref:site-specific DNA-methyltransferase (adenine-specific) n=1 Tax=Bifidobacterium cuniculi TaxID=1688 RepID=A0A087ATH4_9BIFI|nr:BREX-1 system adenine-specific DNA-methyltransferase PglX [Bifidobacterium cuniculi]KFI62074.1 type IIS restriction enzyme [Bifidobacterium cuniculi]
MNTTQLQRFASQARTRLMAAVRARLDRALAPNSDVQVNMSKAFRELQHQLAEQGEDALVEQYAYRWFNRIIAFRYMDVMGFTAMPVVSPMDLTDANGVPAVLAAAKRGEYDQDVFTVPGTGNAQLHRQIEALFNGETASSNAQEDAYGLILQAECRYWHRFMSFMFPDTNAPAGRVDELLMPPDLLAEGSVLRNAIEVMTPEACGVDEPGGNVEIIGWLYQFYIAERKDEVMAGFKKKLKGDADTIPAATQLFTPDWIVRYLVQNSVGRLWMQNHPESALADGWEYYIQPTEAADGDVLRIDSPEDLTVCDPACGSGHMLTYAFDLLTEIYEEQGYAPSEIPGLILEHNLFGMEIDERAADLAAFALTMKARAHSRRFFRRQVMPHICQIRKEEFTADEVNQLNDIFGMPLSEESWNTYAQADVTGSLIQPDAELATLADNVPDSQDNEPRLDDDLRERGDRVLKQTRYLDRQYATVVANPPYMGSKNMGKVLKKYVQEYYPDGKSDLFAAFMLRCLQFVPNRGYLGFMSPYVWMFISSYEALRQRFITKEHIESLIQLEYSGFEGATVPICTFVLQKGTSSLPGHYVRLADFVGAQVQGPRALEIIQAHNALASDQVALHPDMATHFYTVDQQEFKQIPGSPIVYWLPKVLIQAFNIKIAKGVSGEALSDIADVAQGFTTGNNARFLRNWWENSYTSIQFDRSALKEKQQGKWVPCDKGGDFRKWFGNNTYVIDWSQNGNAIFSFHGATPRNRDVTFKQALTCSKITSGEPSFRYHHGGFVFSDAAVAVCDMSAWQQISCFLNSTTCLQMMQALSPTLNFEVGQIRALPLRLGNTRPLSTLSDSLLFISRSDWNSYETSWDFGPFPLLSMDTTLPLAQLITEFRTHWDQVSEEQRQREIRNNEIVADAYGVRDDVPCNVPIERVSLKRNKAFAYPKDTEEERNRKFVVDTVKELISYAVGCMFGRYSFDKPGLILASQGETLEDYHRQVPEPSFEPDADNIIPVCADDYFEDDIVARFRTFLRVAFGEPNFTRNLAFIEETLGESIRDYFVKDFYDDHLRMYSNRPIYWQYSSRTDKKGAFKALMYLHRYTPTTTNAALGVLRDFTGRIADVADMLEQSERAADKRQAEKLRKAVIECRAYEDNVLYPLAATNMPMDLDDGVLVNYLRMGAALRKVDSIEKKRKDVTDWTWPHYPLEQH